MNYEVKRQILDKIKEYDRIMLFRHVRNDGDCVCATKGMKRILQLSFPEKEIYLIDSDKAQYLEFLGPEDEPVADELYADALGIVIDTASEARISNKKYTLCKELIKIDHHIPLESYGNIIWVEEERSSACEMIADFYGTFRDELKIDQEGATYLYTGMVTDSGRFKYEGVTGDTMRCAATLLDVGVDTQTLFARLYLEAFEYLKFKAHIYQRMQITENGVAYIFIDKAMQEEFGQRLRGNAGLYSRLHRVGRFYRERHRGQLHPRASALPFRAHQFHCRTVSRWRSRLCQRCYRIQHRRNECFTGRCRRTGKRI